MDSGCGSLTIVGLGPGGDAHITPAAFEAIKSAEVVVGYVTYIRLIRHLIGDKEIVKTGMTEEIGRARSAVERARAGDQVCIVSSGDAGVYGMCGLVFQVLEQDGWRRGDAPDIHIVPGMTALNACASLVGAPLGHDFCTISLSDLLTPWSVIEKRIAAAAEADFVIGLYNPASGRRTRQIVEAQRIVAGCRPGTTPVALVKSAYRKRQNVVISDVASFLEHEIGMLTTVIVGSTNTRLFEGYMVTPRGYTHKYLPDGTVRKGQQPARSLNAEGALHLRVEGSL